jgi:hypothetical protein
VAIGFEPAETCNPQEQPITWDRAGPGFEGRIAALEERVAQQTVGAPSPVELFAAATVDFIFDDSGVTPTIMASVGPIESVTQVGYAQTQVKFGEVVFGGVDPQWFISLATNSSDGSDHCTYAVLDYHDTVDVFCWKGDAHNHPSPAQWSLTVFAVPTP